MQNTIKKGLASMLAFVLAFACAWGLFSAPAAQAAYADQATQATAQKSEVTVAGVDFLEPTADRWELLRVDGLNAGAAVYLDLVRTNNGAVDYLADRTEYFPVGSDGQESATIAQIISVNMAGAEGDATAADIFADYTDHPTYTIAAYTAARGEAPKFEGTIYPVYAKLADGSGAPIYSFMGLRTASAAETMNPKNMGVGTTYGYEGAIYTRSDVAGMSDVSFDVANQCFTVDYTITEADSITGMVRYVDAADGTVVRTDTYPGITATNPANVTLEKSFFKDTENGKIYYRALCLTNEVALTTRSASFTVRVVSVPNLPADAYQVTVRYVEATASGAEGRLLMTDEVNVKGLGHSYTLPDRFSASTVVDGEVDGVEVYQLKSIQGNLLNETLALEAAAEGEVAQASKWSNPLRFNNTITRDDLVEIDGDLTITAEYAPLSATKEVPLTIREIDGESGAVLSDQVLTITPDNTEANPATYVPADSKTVNGLTYNSWSGNPESISYTWDSLASGEDMLRYVYYLPEGYVMDEGYDITVQYVNIADNRVLRSMQLPVDPEENDYVPVLGDASFELDGNTYVRLAGQENTIYHAFFSPTRTYTVYYRDVNDELNANRVIIRTQVINTTFPGGGTGSAAGGTLAGLALPGADGAVDAGITEGDGATIIDDDENPLANQSGMDTATERVIEDEDNPLASSASLFASPWVAAACVAIAIIALGSLAFFLILRRRQGDSDDDSVRA